MSVQSIQQRISSIQREIQSLERRLTEETKKEASKTNRIAQINRSITKSTSISILQSKQREIQRCEGDIARTQQKKADLTKRITDKTVQLHKNQQDLYKEQEREQKKFQKSIERKELEARRRQEGILSQLRTVLHEGSSAAIIDEEQTAYDAFISHASEDKDDLVRPLAEELIKSGYTIWYDEFQLKVGDSLRRSIDKGLARSRFGIVVLSPAFFSKNWTQYELDGLVAKEISGGKVVLPIWHKVSKDEVLKHSPTLADKFALNTAMYTIDELAKQLSDVMKKS